MNSNNHFNAVSSIKDLTKLQLELNMWKRILESLDRAYSEPSIEELLKDWKKKPERFFVAQQLGKELKWCGPSLGVAPMDGYSSDSHGLMSFPDMKVSATFGSNENIFGWVESISMVEGGVVRIKHFALNDKLVGQSLGIVLYNSILSYFKKRHAICVEFDENHSEKIDYYISFFKKHGVPEVKKRVWRAELYPRGKIPLQVKIFQAYIKLKVLKLKH